MYDTMRLKVTARPNKYGGTFRREDIKITDAKSGIEISHVQEIRVRFGCNGCAVLDMDVIAGTEFALENVDGGQVVRHKSGKVLDSVQAFLSGKADEGTSDTITLVSFDMDVQS